MDRFHQKAATNDGIHFYDNIIHVRTSLLDLRQNSSSRLGTKNRKKEKVMHAYGRKALITIHKQHK